MSSHNSSRSSFHSFFHSFDSLISSFAVGEVMKLMKEKSELTSSYTFATPRQDSEDK